jgi:hypothetical protein
LEHFGRALRIRWLWYQWKNPDKPWCGSEPPLDNIDEALFAAATTVQVNDGQTAGFWTSSWLNGLSPASMFPSLYKHSKRKNRTVADAMTNDNWIRDLIHNITTQLFADYVLLWGLVDAVAFDHSAKGQDEIIWSRTADGTYLAKSAYCMQFEGSI